MPDRAVVDEVPTCGRCGGPLTQSWDPDVGGLAWTCENTAAILWTYGEPIDAGLPEPPPRALVALSEDRQWLAVLNPSDRVAPCWLIYRWCHTCPRAWVWESMREDTGQDAHQVLAEWIAGR